MDTAIDINDPGKALDLANIRFQLIRLEDTVLFHIIERVQFPYNKTIYVPGAIEIPGSDLSFSEWVLREQEAMQSKIRRYQSPRCDANTDPHGAEVPQDPVGQRRQRQRRVEATLRERHLARCLRQVWPRRAC